VKGLVGGSKQSGAAAFLLTLGCIVAAVGCILAATVSWQ
jgi:hypothetical protein